MQQRSSFGKRTFDLSPEIYHLARKEELGELRNVYAVSKQNTTLFGIGMICITLSVSFGLIFLPLVLSTVSTLLTLTVPALILLLTGLYLTLSRRIYARWHLSLWQHGFIYEKKQIRQAFRWNQIERIEGSAGRMPNLQGVYSYKVRRQDGYEVTLGTTFLGISELIDTLLEESARHLAPHELSITPRHNISTFTNLKLDRQGIGNGQETLSWEEIQEFVTHNGTVTLRKQVE